MKKIICLALSLLMLMSLFTVSAFAEEEEELSELISFEETNRKETEHFVLTAKSCDSEGWRGGNNYYKLTITAKGSNIIITRIEAVIGDYGNLYDRVGISGGEKRETDRVNNGDTVHIDNINSNTFSFSGGNIDINFKDITVYYVDIRTHIFDKDNKCTICGKTKCQVEGHSYEKGICSVCNVKGCEIGELEHDWNNGVCSVCECECEHTYDDKGKCTNCKTECPHTHITQICDECGVKIENGPHTASTISEGNMTIICSVACLAVGLCGGFVLGRKKKPTPANVVGNDEE